MASVSKHFIARHGVAVGATPTTVISDTGAATITNLSVSGSLQTAFNLNSQILTNANIDSGTIDGATIATSDITVGSGKTLNVSAGTLTLANDQISGDKIHGGTISGSPIITTPYIATMYAQAATGGILTLRANSTDLTTGYVSLPDTLQATSTVTGALRIAGGVGIAKDVFVGGNINAVNLTLSGNFTVNGTTTTVNSTTVTIDDPVFTLGGDTAPGADDNKDRGIEFRWHNGTTAKVGFFGLDDSTGKFTFIPDATNTSEVFSGTKGTLDANIEWADVLNKPDPVVTVTLTGDVTGTGNATLTDLGNGTISFATTIAANSVALGTDTTGNYAADVGVSGNGLSITGTAGEGTSFTVNSNATNLNTASTLVFRDGSGNFNAGTITAALSGNATTATTLATARAINGVNFDGSAAITVPVNVTDDTTTNATYYPSFAQATSGNTAHKVASTKLTFNPSTGVLAATTFSGSAASLTSVPAGQLTGTIPTGVLGNSTLYIGTTAIALNRGSAAQSLTGITSIDGNAATATILATTRAINGVNFNGSAAITVPVNSTDDVATATAVYPLWTTAAGNTAAKISTTKLSFVPSTGNLTLAGNLNIANTVSTSDATAYLMNTNSTTINFGGACTTMQIGAAGSTININGTTASTTTTSGALVVDGGVGVAGNINAGGSVTAVGLTLSGDLAVNGGDITTTSTTFNLVNATATTLNVGGAATTLSIGSTGAAITTFNGTAAIVLPVGTDANRPGTPTVGMIRYSSTAGKFEGYTAGGWGGIGGGSEITDDTSTDATYYPGFVTATTGAADILKVSSTKLTFNPSTGTLSSTNFNSLSDSRYKENVVSIESGVETINQLRGVGFDWIDSGKASFGVIAQELEKVLPALVEESPVAKTVNYTGIIAFLIKAVQELDARVKELEK